MDVLSVDRTVGNTGRYFHFDAAQLSAILNEAGTLWDNTDHAVTQFRNGLAIKSDIVVTWDNPNGGK